MLFAFLAAVMAAIDRLITPLIQTPAGLCGPHRLVEEHSQSRGWWMELEMGEHMMQEVK